VSLTQPEAAAVQDLPDAAQEAAYRIVQEALTNVVRHSGARKAAVVLALEGTTADGKPGKQLTVTIDDDGAGAAGVPEGNGVTGMRERAAAVGGSLLHLAPLHPGWRVRAVIPVAGPLARPVPGPEREAR
jgi:signal transduction histidine kinase